MLIDSFKALAVFAVACGLIVLMSLAGGCSLDEIVKVDVPPNTREHYRDNLDTAVPPVITLRDARILREQGDRKFRESIKAQEADHLASNDALDAEIADGSFIESVLGSAVNTGIQTAIPGLSTVPGGAILTTLLAGLGMWMVPRPGDARRRKEAEDKGYDMGRAETTETVAAVTNN